MQLYKSTSCQQSSRVVRAFSDVEKPFLFSDLAVKAAKSENIKVFSMSEKARISSRVNSYIDKAAGGIATSFLLSLYTVFPRI